MTGFLIKGEIGTYGRIIGRDTDRRRPAVTAAGMPEAPTCREENLAGPGSKLQKMGQSISHSLAKKPTHRHLDFGLLALRTIQ